MPSADKPPVKREAAGVKEGKLVAPLVDKKRMNDRPCVGNKDGRPHSCKFGDACTFQHVSVQDKSKQRLLDIVGPLTATARTVLTRAVLKRS